MAACRHYQVLGPNYVIEITAAIGSLASAPPSAPPQRGPGPSYNFSGGGGGGSALTCHVNDLVGRSWGCSSLQASRKLGTKDVKGAKMDKSKRKKHMAHMRKLYGLGCERPHPGLGN